MEVKIFTTTEKTQKFLLIEKFRVIKSTFKSNTQKKTEPRSFNRERKKKHSNKGQNMIHKQFKKINKIHILIDRPQIQ